MNDGLERILRTLSQSGFGLFGALGIQNGAHVGASSLTGEMISIGCIVGVAAIMNYGPKWLRPIAGQVMEKITEEKP